MNKLLVTILASVFATAALAQKDVEAQTPGSAGPKAAAEAKHQAKQHGIDNSAKQPEAQMSGSAKSQAVAESKHMKKKHGKVNDSADQRLEKAHQNH